MSSATLLTMDVEAAGAASAAPAKSSTRRNGLTAAVLVVAALALAAIAMVCSQQLSSSAVSTGPVSRSLYQKKSKQWYKDQWWKKNGWKYNKGKKNNNNNNNDWKKKNNNNDKNNNNNDKKYYGNNNGVKFGVSSDGRDIKSLENLIDAKVDVIMKYQSVKNLGRKGKYQQIMGSVLNSGKEGVLTMEFKGANLYAIKKGAFDNDLRQLGRDIKKDGRPIWLRPLHEFNGDWYPWGTFTNGQNPEIFKEAYRHIVKVVRSQGAWNAKWQLAYNNKSPRENQTPYIRWYPGNDVVDLICASAYNWSWDGNQSFEKLFAGVYDKLNKLPGGKPLGWCEGSTVGSGVDKGQWFKDATKAIRRRFTRVKQVIFFLNNKRGEGDFDLNGHHKAFGAALRGENNN